MEKSVSKLTNKKQPTFKSKMAPPKPRPITPPQEKPEPTFLKGMLYGITENALKALN